jgi:uncharacterized protein (DUF4213/DUF364 family)
MNDILKFLFEQCPFEPCKLKATAIGDKYVGIMLQDGNIGVCAALNQLISELPVEVLSNPNLKKYEHRVIVNAWVNACLNYTQKPTGNGDIFEAVHFDAFETIVMVGYFGSLASKFYEKGLKLTIFDLNEHEEPVEPIDNQKQYLQKADCLILTSSSLANDTYQNLLCNINAKCKVYLLGPSTPFTNILVDKLAITGLFGARFMPFDSDVLQVIEQGKGTKSFLGRMEKVYFLKD